MCAALYAPKVSPERVVQGTVQDIHYGPDPYCRRGKSGLPTVTYHCNRRCFQTGEHLNFLAIKIGNEWRADEELSHEHFYRNLQPKKVQDTSYCQVQVHRRGL